MIEKMKYINITGPIDLLDTITEGCLSAYDIQFENAAKKMGAIDGLRPFSMPNPFAEHARMAADLLASLERRDRTKADCIKIDADRAVKTVESAHINFLASQKNKEELRLKKEECGKNYSLLSHFSGLDFDFNKLESFKHINYAFGCMPRANYMQFESFLYGEPEILFAESETDRDFVWGVYFTPAPFSDKVRSIFNSLHFETFDLADAYNGAKNEMISAAAEYWKNKLAETESLLSEPDVCASAEPEHDPAELRAACEKIMRLNDVYGLRKNAAVTAQGNFIYVGWTTRKDAKRMAAELSGYGLTFFSREYVRGDPETDLPPTRLKNLPVVGLFEFFVKMYGLPRYGEMDPTPIMAVVYTLLFGIMFGDAGHGICLAVIGLLLYATKKNPLGGIMAAAGFSGMIFGFVYGIVFGLEDVLRAYLKKPAEDIIGTLLFAVAVGAGLILMSMALNIVNALKKRDMLKFFLDPNGISGFIFYGAVVLAIYMSVYGNKSVNGLFVAAACLPLLVVALREPFCRIIKGERFLSEGLGMFAVGTVIGLYEVLLSYAANTISFVRVGAFALTHAGMMAVVALLARNSSGLSHIAFIVLGNLLVIAIEGLLVGIQVLRLNFYELFSRFYQSGGKPFTPSLKKEAVK
ncbi:MAG: hypothetical protein FWE82_00620 [Defluviitaleaceae bacterium]|nr:hypothetical protein [Defluviitaleaceae bacterium]